MFGDLTSSFADLSLEQRTMLAELLETRSEYWQQADKVNKLRIAELRNPTLNGEQHIREVASTLVAPVRIKMSEQALALLQNSVNVDQFKSMAPMLAMVLLQSVNLPLLLATFGIEPDQIEQLTGKLSTFIKDGLQ